jgi:hypothetical protein
MMFNLAERLRINEQQRPWVRVFFLVSLDPLSIAMYSFMFLKIHGLDQAVYFLAVPSADWPRGLMPGQAVPGIEPAQRLVGIARPTLMMKMNTSGCHCPREAPREAAC